MSSAPPFEALLLAAGRSTRFGADKLLHSLPDGRAVAVAACANLRAAGVDVVAVVRLHNLALAQRLAAVGARVITCDSAGMGDSIACGIAKTTATAGYLIALADMPWIQVRTIQRVVEALKAGADMMAPVYRGRRGHPVGFSRSWRDRLLALRGDAGARDLLTDPTQLQTLDCDDPGVLADIDRPGDLPPG